MKAPPLETGLFRKFHLRGGVYPFETGITAEIAVPIAGISRENGI
jgi:hypothetical protein